MLKRGFLVSLLSACSLYPNIVVFLKCCCRPKVVFVLVHDGGGWDKIFAFDK